MSTIRYRDRDSSAASAVFVALGALAGLASGVLLAQRMGGISGISTRVRDRIADARREGRPGDDADDRPMGHDQPEYDDEPLDANGGPTAGRGAAGRGANAGARRSAGAGAGTTGIAARAGAAPSTTAGGDDDGEALEERVLEAFRNDPVLSERAVDIGAVGRGIIELTGYVQAEGEAHSAVVLTRGVPGVITVVNRLEVREEEARYEQSAQQYATGETEASPMWEGMQVGIGKPRQGTSQDGQMRHADPKPILEDRWLGQQAAIRAAADDLDGLAERRQHADAVQGDETGGAPIAPTGVPKGDHVADPASAAPYLREQTGRVDPNLRG